MPDSTPPRPPRLILVADAHEWPTPALASILRPSGYDVVHVHTAAHAAAAARTRRDDAILLTETLPDGDVAKLVRSLREDPRVPDETPIVLLGAAPVSRSRLLAALRAGANDLWGLPMDAEELVLRLETLVRTKAIVARVREESLIDSATGFYNRRGLTVRARDLASLAVRRRGALACLVVAPVLETGRVSRTYAQRLDMAVEAVADGLKGAGRASDAIGRLSLTEFAVLAPDADADGARRLGSRLRQAIEGTSRRPRASHPVRVRAGYHAEDDFHTAGLGALDLVARATTALRAAERGRAGTWIRGFEAL